MSSTMSPKTVQLAGRQFKPFRQPVFTWAWHVLNTIAAFYLWLSVLPYRIAEAITPDPLNKYVVDAGTYFWTNYTEPLTVLIQSLSYQTFDVIDQQVDWLFNKVTGVHASNMRHFRVALEDKASTVEQHGLRGVPAAMSMKTS